MLNVISDAVARVITYTAGGMINQTTLMPQAQPETLLVASGSITGTLEKPVMSKTLFWQMIKHVRVSVDTSGGRQVERANMDGSDLHVIIKSTNIIAPRDLAANTDSNM